MSTPDKEKPPIDLYRAGRQFERMMMGVDPNYRNDAPREDRATFAELQEIRSRQSPPINPEDFGPVIATSIIKYSPEGRIISVGDWERTDPKSK